MCPGPKAPYWFTDSYLHMFLRLKGVVQSYPDLKLYTSPGFLTYLRTRLNVAKSTTLTGRTVASEVFIDGVLVHVDATSTKYFYIYY